MPEEMAVSQSKLMSFAEAWVNIFVGYGVAVFSQTLIFPLFGIHLPLHDHLLMGGFFTVVSLVRSYCLRRFFNWLHVRNYNKHAEQNP